MPEASVQRPKMSTGGSPATSDIQRYLVRMVALADPPCELWFLARLLARAGVGTRLALETAVEELIARGTLVDGPTGLRLASPRLREGVLAELPLSMQRGLHESAAEVLAEAGRPAPAARRLLQAMPTVGQGARTLAARLATDPAVSPTLSADLLLACGAPGAPDHQLDWLVATADHLFLAGRLPEAMLLLRTELAVARCAAHQRALLLGRLGAYHATQRPSLSMRYLERALEEHLGGPERSWTLAMRASVAARFGYPDSGDLLAEAQRAHRTAPAPEGGIRLALAQAAQATVGADLPRAARILHEVDTSAPGARSQVVFLRVDRIANQLSLGQFTDARSALEAVTEEIDTLGGVARPLVTALDCVARLAVGEFAEASARARLALEDPAAEALPDEARATLLGTVVEELLRRDEVSMARALLAPEKPALDWPDGLQWFRLGAAAAADPEPERHAPLLRAMLRMSHRAAAPLLLVPHHGPRLVRAALLLDDHRHAQILADHLKRVAGTVNNRLWQGIAHQADGIISGDPSTLATAVARLRTTTARPALADAMFDLGRSPHLPRREAVDVLDECAALYARLGATGDHDRARQLRRHLATGDRERSTARPDGVQALTPAEARVAELLARGATKQQAADELFVSFHTVDTQLRAIYAKLGIRTRVQLARLWDAHRPS
ncbi:LuxR C-terminal-related transcriptional regulator [Micromonospora sp. NPDC047134]|uniref:helix-turn-helix transcriptional regulator n=1 Tax=Micromonospora sp. NPDC047134 TaxID=3154340 RepID=UPI0033F6E481